MLCIRLCHNLCHTCRVTLPEDYFLSELLYSPCEDLDNISTVSLIVVTFGQDSQATRAKRARMSDNGSGSLACNEALKLLAGAQHWILDIDLDFFSTANPFCGSLSKVWTSYAIGPCYLNAQEQLDLLRDLYHFDIKHDKKVSMRTF